MLAFFRKLFSRPEPANPYRAMLDARWKAYEEWRDSQVCVGCGKAAKDRVNGEPHWVTEYECMECFITRCETKGPHREPAGTDEIRAMFR
jgi:hypothetical protein